MQAGLPFVHPVCVAAIALHFGIRFSDINTLLKKYLWSFAAGILLQEGELRLHNGTVAREGVGGGRKQRQNNEYERMR